MANRVATVKFSEFSKDFRFEPKYYLFMVKHKTAKERFIFCPLSQLGEKIARGQSPKPSTYKHRNNGYNLFIRTADLKRNILNFQTIVYLDNETYGTQKSNRAVSNDLLISVVGNYLGSTVIVPTEIAECAFNDNSARIRITSDKVTPFWVSAFLNSKFGYELIHASATRTGQKILSAGNVKNLEIPILPNESFSYRLQSCIDQLFQAQKLIYKGFDIFSSQLNALQIAPVFNYSSSFLYIENGDLWTPKYSFPQYIQTISDIKQRLKTISLGDIAIIKNGDEVGSDEYISYLEQRESDVPFIRTTDIVNFEPDLYPDFFIPESLYNEICQRLEPNEVLFTKDGKIGITGMINDADKVVLSSGIARLSINSRGKLLGLTPEYLFVALSNPIIGGYQAKQYTVTASTIPHLREDRIKEFIIPIFEKEDISEITFLIQKANRIKLAVKKELKSIKEDIDQLFEF